MRLLSHLCGVHSLFVPPCSVSPCLVPLIPVWSFDTHAVSPFLFSLPLCVLALGSNHLPSLHPPSSYTAFFMVKLLSWILSIRDCEREISVVSVCECAHVCEWVFGGGEPRERISEAFLGTVRWQPGIPLLSGGGLRGMWRRRCFICVWSGCACFTSALSSCGVIKPGCAVFVHTEAGRMLTETKVWKVSEVSRGCSFCIHTCTHTCLQGPSAMRQACCLETKRSPRLQRSHKPGVTSVPVWWPQPALELCLLGACKCGTPS